MAVQIPFNLKLDFSYGSSDQVSPLIRRVIANNPSSFTFHGTGTYIVGNKELAVIDPGPIDQDHLDAIMAAAGGAKITHILITHTHSDHSPGAAPLKALTGAKTYGYGPHGSGLAHASGIKPSEGGDMDFVPDVKINHGDIISGPDWDIECVFTPGHTSNHMCFALQQEKALFSGDHVMGWSTTVISPPDGNMAQYMDSLKLLLQRDDTVYWPTHGTCINDVQNFVQAYMDHRQERAQQILDALHKGASTIADMVPNMYTELDPAMYPAAGRSVYAALLGLIDNGSVACHGEPLLDSEYRLDIP